MNILWKVSHVFRVPMEYKSGPTNFPTLGAVLVVSGTKITQVDHELVAEDSVLAGEIVEISTQQLSILWEAISYVSGYPAWQADIRRVERSTTGRPSSPSKTSLHHQPGRSAIVRLVQLPKETKLLQTAGRLQVWLRLANDARPPATAVDAIRNYHMICEDMLSGQGPTQGPEEELKFIRNFVSHGVAMGDQALLAFLQREIGPGTSQYDPINQTHRTFLEQRG